MVLDWLDLDYLMFNQDQVGVILKGCSLHGPLMHLRHGPLCHQLDSWPPSEKTKLWALTIENIVNEEYGINREQIKKKYDYTF